MLNQKTFLESLSKLNPNYPHFKYLLGVSGGADSMVLLHLFRKSGLYFEVAHVNYQLRGESSEKDQQLVKNTCEKSKIPFHLYSITDEDNRPKNSIQEWARDLRYNFFEKIKNEQQLAVIVTAHHLNDQLETFIINLSKASGINGLCGIPANDHYIYRPLLQFSKTEIYQFAREYQIEFREDLSNQKSDYLRNKIRNEISPRLLEVNEHFLENFAKSLEYLKQTRHFVSQQLLKIDAKIIEQKEDSITINKELFRQESNYVQFEILRKYDFTEVKEIEKINIAEVGKKFNSKNFELLIDREKIIIKPHQNENLNISEFEILLNIDQENNILIPENILQSIEIKDRLHWNIDGLKVELPLKLRPKKDGDLFYPIGMIGKKKIAKFFKDEKIPILAQQKIWILCDADDQILGIIPHRQDRRFTANKNLTEVIQLKLKQ